MDKNKRLKVHR